MLWLLGLCRVQWSVLRGMWFCARWALLILAAFSCSDSEGFPGFRAGDAACAIIPGSCFHSCCSEQLAGPSQGNEGTWV